MNENIAVLTKGLTKKYKEHVAVDHLDLEIRDGELFALLGVNGAGKTTTLRMLSCLSAPTEGTAEVYGFDVMRDAHKVKELIGVSPQDTAVAEKLTVFENLRFMAGIYGLQETERANELIKAFHLEEVRNARAKTLSGGWKRRLSIAMALVSNPKLLFLDEPTLGLDVLARRELWEVIRTVKEHTTIILTTHYMEEAEALSDRIGILISGRLTHLGTLAQLEQETGRKGLEEVFLAAAGK
ncbi:MAG: ABC transporter ATP-binding protein [Eubacterium sp.]|nr:ABC transporter ATP-binding protein [Eubacterium sp.]